MVNITNIHVHYRAMNGKTFMKKINPSDKTNTLAIKKDVARFVSTIKSSSEYYYVVLVIESGGESRYRTIVPKTLLQG